MAVNNKINISLDAKDNVSKAFKKLSKNSESLSGKLKSIGGPLKKMSLGIGVLGASAGVVGTKMFSMGADMEQVMKKSQTVFGEYFNDMDEFAKKTGQAMGLSRTEFLKTASGIQDLLIPMGFTREEATKQTQEIIGLSGALSEWSAGQYSAAEVGDIMAKAMLGEREQLKSLGISITEADVQQKLLEMGMEKLTGTQLQQAKATATQKLIFEKSTDAQASFEKGAGSLTRKKAELTATIKNTQETIVNSLLPAFYDVVEYLKPIIENVAESIKLWFENKENVEKLTTSLKAIVTVFGTVFSVIGKTIGLFYKMGEGLGLAMFNVIQFVDGAKTKFGEFRESAIEVFTGVRDWAVDTMSDMKQAVIDRFTAMLDFVRNALQKAKDTAKEIASLGFAKTETFNGDSVSGTKANGGNVVAGQKYIVGERGREEFIPATSGKIIPNGGSGGSGGIHIENINLPSVRNGSDFISELKNMARLQNIGVT